MTKKVHKLETDILRETMLALGQRDDVILWRQNTGGIEFGGPSSEDIKRAIAILMDVRRVHRSEDALTCLRSVLARKTQMIRYGLKGQADLTGVLIIHAFGGWPFGVRLELELKSESGKQTKEQKDFEAMMLRAGVVYICARSAAEAIEGVDRAKREIGRRLL